MILPAITKLTEQAADKDINRLASDDSDTSSSQRGFNTGIPVQIWNLILINEMIALVTNQKCGFEGHRYQ